MTPDSSALHRLAEKSVQAAFRSFHKVDAPIYEVDEALLVHHLGNELEDFGSAIFMNFGLPSDSGTGKHVDLLAVRRTSDDTNHHTWIEVKRSGQTFVSGKDIDYTTLSEKDIKRDWEKLIIPQDGHWGSPHSSYCLNRPGFYGDSVC